MWFVTSASWKLPIFSVRESSTSSGVPLPSTPALPFGAGPPPCAAVGRHLSVSTLRGRPHSSGERSVVPPTSYANGGRESTIRIATSSAAAASPPPPLLLPPLLPLLLPLPPPPLLLPALLAPASAGRGGRYQHSCSFMSQRVPSTPSSWFLMILSMSAPCRDRAWNRESARRPCAVSRSGLPRMAAGGLRRKSGVSAGV
mmetsp:Transcript_22156/g.70778  ORF Transcript_22156/g.70778 Transcript_22156/m.70778 type:complete len:200 (-) Transcript_22156:123-722(-)